jgi:Class III cytochrome C family
LHNNDHGARLSPSGSGFTKYPDNGQGIADNLYVISKKLARGRALVCFALFCLLPGAAWAQISPGPLSRAHKSLDGATQCTTCHKFGGEAALKCLDCHSEIVSRVASHKGLHATYHLNPGSSQECARCHSEHNGLDFPVVKWDPKTFDHKQTGYALEGKHAGLACNKCHTPDHVSPAERPTIKYKDLSKTFLGVPTACVTCHKDEHEGRLGKNCLQCHNYNDWKSVATQLGQFDHSKTRYPLTGLHAQVTCQKCHTPGPDNKPRYAGLPFSKCSDCHSDPHHGSFARQTCQSCHNTNGWKRVSTAALNQSFDHSKTKYPLLGKHQQVECVQCHVKGDFKKQVAFQQCTDCHKDEHGGQFVKRADKGECASCHTVEGFKPAKYGVKEHAASAYPLEAKHATLQCAQCHIPKGKETLYKMKFARCMDCHKDDHQGQFAAAPYLNRCEQCHTLNGYRPSTYTLAKHKESRFVLTGGHIATPCGDCHKDRSTPEAKYAVLYRFEDRSCTVCHSDPHRGQFRDRMQKVRKDGSAAGCEACHSTKSWRELTAFDHEKTSFPLVGTHRAVACIDCHKPPNLETKLTNVDFKAAPGKCEECHADIHGAQFANAARLTPCADCHNTIKWKPSLFDHDKRTKFALEGVHRNVRCAGCHQLMRDVDGKQVLFYMPTPRDCAACHGPNIKKS